MLVYQRVHDIHPQMVVFVHCHVRFFGGVGVEPAELMQTETFVAMTLDGLSLICLQQLELCLTCSFLSDKVLRVPSKFTTLLFL